MLLNSLFRHWSYRLFAPGTMLRERYEALKQLLNLDIYCHEQMAEFQDMLHGGHLEDLVAIRRRFTQFSSQVEGMVASLETISPGSYASLKSYHKKFDFYTRFLIAPPAIQYAPPFVIPLDEITQESKTIGNKAKHLALLKKTLDITVPAGYAITTGGYHYFIEYNDLRPEIDRLLQDIHIQSPGSLNEISARLQDLILAGQVPPALEEEMNAAFAHLEQECSAGELAVAVRSSAIAEDSGFSFAGQYATRLDVKKSEVAESYKQVLASKYSSEALYYRISSGLGDEETAMSVLVQCMVPAVASGVVYTRDTVSSREMIHVLATRGLGERLVSGAETPEAYIFSHGQQPAPLSNEGSHEILDPASASLIAKTAMAIEELFNTPQDIEWAIDGANTLNILQARELHTEIPEHSRIDEAELCEERVLIADLKRASTGAACGEVYHLDGQHNLESVPDGAVLVAAESPPEYVKILGKVAAVISEKGSRASHFATVAREFGVPFLTGKEDAGDFLEPGMLVTVDGYQGRVFAGRIDPLLKHAEAQTHRKFRSTPLHQAMKFITPLELVDPLGDNFTPEGCRSMHDIIRFCHEMALHAMFTTARPGTGRGALRLVADIPLDVFLFDVGGGFSTEVNKRKSIPLDEVASEPFQAIWKGMSHPDVQWKQKPFDWAAYDKIELAGGVPPKRDSFAFASYAVIGGDYLHFNIRFGYHFTIVDVLLGNNPAENYCMLRFAGGGGDYDQRLLRIDFITGILEQLDFHVEQKGDLLEAKVQGLAPALLSEKLDMVGRLLGATKLMDMVLEDDAMVATCIEEFFNGRYSFSQEG